MVYTTQFYQRKQLGSSVKLDHEYTTMSHVMTPMQLQQLQMNRPIVVQARPQPGQEQQHQQHQQQQQQYKLQTVRLTQQQHFYASLSEQAKTALTRDTLANKLRQNWQQKNPQDSSRLCSINSINLDDSLTSLGWLHGMNIMKSVSSPTPPPSPTPDTEVNPNSILTVINNVQPHRQPETYTFAHNTTTATAVERIDYRANAYVKPPYSYATLICMAIKETGVEKITLSSIYQWITENFMYYRLADPSWQNSIRHNLSLNKCFQKVPRRKDEPGKGGFWRINPEYNDMLVDGVLKKRRTNVNTYYPPLKRIKMEPEDPWGSDRPEAIVPQSVSNKERQFVINEGVSANDLRNGNYSWNQLLNQDIMVGGVTIKTEDIIDDSVMCLEEEQQQPAQHNQGMAFMSSDIGEMTPPSSGNSNSDNSLDEIFDFTTDYQNSPLDMSSTGVALDLTLQGHGVKAPETWFEVEELSKPQIKQAGMHTPVHESDSLDDWKSSRLSVEEAIEAFDIDNLFET